MKRVHFKDAAKEEMREAANWYEGEATGLGERFIKAAEDAATNMVAEPLLGREIEDGVRKLNFEGFPYALVYEVATDFVVVYAVMHLHRKPGYWRNRK